MNFPIHNVISRLLNEIKDNPNVVLQAEPGAGKSTIVPLELLNAEFLTGQKIIMLEPRRMAARSIAKYLATCLGERVGETVGYQVKNEKKISSSTRLEILTEGVLTRRLQSNPDLDGVGLIIFDEFHERSINTDLSLMLSTEIQQVLREDLRILVMSATLDTQLVSNYLTGAPIVLCEGRSYPVSVSHQKTDKRQLATSVCKAIHSVIEDNGDILIFLSGIADIKRCISQAESSFSSESKLVFMPLHGSLSLTEQEKCLAPVAAGFRKVIFSTNIAETSLTIEGVTCVIDSGLEKRLTFNPASGMSRLATANISKASAEQRKGRAGRLCAGKCIRLWTESEHLSLKDFQEEEIVNADLSDALLELASAGHSSFEQINWLTPPPKAHFDSTQALLIKLGMFDEFGKITTLGAQASALPVHPRLAKMLLSASSADEKELACYIAALLSERDVLQRADSADLLLRLHLLLDNNTHLQNINRNTLKAVKKDVSTLMSLIKHKSNHHTVDDLVDICGYLLLLAFPERLAKRRSINSNKFQLANGKGVFLVEDDPLTNEEYIVVNDCDAQQKEGRVFSAIPIDKTTLINKFSAQLTEHTDYALSPNKNIYGLTQKKYGSLVIEEVRSNEVPQSELVACINALLKTDFKHLITWTKSCDDWLQRASWLSKQMPDFPDLSKEVVINSVEEWLLPYVANIKKITELKKVKVFPLLTSILSYQEANILETHAPTTYITPSNKKISIEYNDNQGPTVSVVLQEVFGELASPMLANNSVPLRFELLSPAKRPIQITSDLANFWQGSYVEVAKDMRAKYPKHRWPTEPLLEKPGRSIKRRH